MLKLSTNKYGVITLDEKRIRSVIEKLIFDVVDKKSLIKIDFDIKKGSLKKVEIFLDKNSDISIEDQKMLYNQIMFMLLMHFGISNSLVIFSYEN
ncbi:MAG: hypothetical protein K2N92_02000 [Malacoplasma sp.]|nr:hypothetical protein [Malacoplasma sp.]MDE5841709.1 hypothetical protein [Malacoplasma sp.]MDE6429232.1 hypothetical protein [Malacoplasma sp.]MDE7112352.1 hypothetical protein [Malacoplasma sp.]